MLEMHAAGTLPLSHKAKAYLSALDQELALRQAEREGRASSSHKNMRLAADLHQASVADLSNALSESLIEASALNSISKINPRLYQELLKYADTCGDIDLATLPTHLLEQLQTEAKTVAERGIIIPFNDTQVKNA